MRTFYCCEIVCKRGHKSEFGDLLAGLSAGDKIAAPDDVVLSESITKEEMLRSK